MAENLELIGLKVETSRAVKSIRDMKRRLDGLDSKFTKTTRAARKTSTAMTTGFNRTASSLKSLVAGYIGFTAALATGRAILRAVSDMEQLEARVATLTGSVSAGAAAMKDLTAFASETPFALDQSVRAFARFRSVGISPTITQMRNLGNFASALGSDIESAAAAVVQGSFAETERLKSLAVATQVSATEIKLTYDDISRSIQRTGDARQDAGAILDFVTELGASRFGTAMADQMETIAGATSNLRDSLQLLAVEIGEGGFREGWSRITAGAAALTSEMTEQLRVARELAEAESRTLDLRSKTYQESLARVAQTNQLERDLLASTLRGNPEQERAALKALGFGGDDEKPPSPPKVLEHAENQFRLDDLRAQIIELTHGREAADRFRVAVAGTASALVDEELALERARDGLIQHQRATEYAAQAEEARQARIVHALTSQERYVVLLNEGRQAAARLDFLALAPGAEQLAAWDALAERIEAASMATIDLTDSGRAMRSAMREAEQRALALESAVASLLRTAVSGQDVLGQLASVLQGYLIDQVAGRIAGSFSPAPTVPGFDPAGLDGVPDIFHGQRPGLAGERAPVVHFSQSLSVSTIDAQGVHDFLETHHRAIGAAAVQAISESASLRAGIG